MKLICSVFDDLFPKWSPYEKLLSYVSDRPGHDWRYAIDNRKISTELGWSPVHSFEKGIAETVKWYLREYPEWAFPKL